MYCKRLWSEIELVPACSCSVSKFFANSSTILRQSSGAQVTCGGGGRSVNRPWCVLEQTERATSSTNLYLVGITSAYIYTNLDHPKAAHQHRLWCWFAFLLTVLIAEFFVVIMCGHEHAIAKPKFPPLIPPMIVF